MGAFQRMLTGVKHVDTDMGPGLMKFGASTAIGAATSYTLGQLHGRYRDVEHIEKLPMAVGIVGKLGVLVASAFGIRGGFLLGAADGMAQAGLDAHFLSMGISHGMKASGRKMLVLPPGADAKGLISERRDTVLGEIPAPAPGRYLNRTQLADLARHV